MDYDNIYAGPALVLKCELYMLNDGGDIVRLRAPNDEVNDEDIFPLNQVLEDQGFPPVGEMVIVDG